MFKNLSLKKNLKLVLVLTLVFVVEPYEVRAMDKEAGFPPMRKRKRVDNNSEVTHNNRDTRAKTNRGLSFLEKEDFLNALLWFKIAAQEEDSEAQYNLGMMYALGEGVPINHYKALKWLRKARKNGYLEAKKNVLLIQNKIGCECYNNKNFSEAIKWFKKANKEGFFEVNLGRAYYKVGGYQNLLEAIKWLTKAAASGDTDAELYLERIKSEGVLRDFTEVRK